MMTDPILRRYLQELLETLEAIGAEHEELYDTAVREQMFAAVQRSFLKPDATYQLPLEYGLFELAANEQVHAALTAYVTRARARAKEIGLADPQERLVAFTDSGVKTRGEEQYPDDFFGWAESI